MGIFGWKKLRLKPRKQPEEDSISRGGISGQRRIVWPEQGSTAREGIYRQRRKLQTEKDPVPWRKIYKWSGDLAEESWNSDNGGLGPCLV